MGRITVSKVEHFEKEWLPFFNSIKRKPKVKIEETSIEQLKKVVTKAFSNLEGEKRLGKTNVIPVEETELLIKDSIIRK